MTLWKAAYVNTTIGPEITPTISGSRRGRKVTVTGTLDGGVSAGDLRVGIRIFNKEKRFGPLLKYTKRIWSKVLYKNY